MDLIKYLWMYMLNFMISPVSLFKPELFCFHSVLQLRPAKLFSLVQYKCWEAFDDADIVYYDAPFCVFQQTLYFSLQVKGENVLNVWISFTFVILFIYVFWIFCDSVKSDCPLFVLLISDVTANDDKPICLWADRLWHSLSKQHNTLAGFPAPWFLWAFWSIAGD